MLILEIAAGVALGTVIGGLILRSVETCRHCGHARLFHGLDKEGDGVCRLCGGPNEVGLHDYESKG